MQCQVILDAVTAWANRELNNKCAVFWRKAAATNMAETQMQMNRNVIFYASEVINVLLGKYSSLPFRLDTIFVVSLTEWIQRH